MTATKRRGAAPLLLLLSLSGSLALAGCTATASTPAPTSPSPLATSATSQSLLDKVTTTILGQALSYPGTTPAQISSSIITLPPGVETGLHRHDAPMYAYILEGQLTVTYDGGIVRTYRPGDALMEAQGTAHNGKNNGSVPVKVLVVNIGASGVANSVSLP